VLVVVVALGLGPILSESVHITLQESSWESAGPPLMAHLAPALVAGSWEECLIGVSGEEAKRTICVCSSASSYFILEAMAFLCAFFARISSVVSWA